MSTNRCGGSTNLHSSRLLAWLCCTGFCPPPATAHVQVLKNKTKQGRHIKKESGWVTWWYTENRPVALQTTRQRQLRRVLRQPSRRPTEDRTVPPLEQGADTHTPTQSISFAVLWPKGAIAQVISFIYNVITNPSHPRRVDEWSKWPAGLYYYRIIFVDQSKDG